MLIDLSPWTVSDPSKGSRVIETNPQDTVASEFTWHGTGTTTYTTTRGNSKLLYILPNIQPKNPLLLQAATS